MTDIPTKVDFWQRNGKWLAGVAVIVVGLGYVLQQVNPETVMQFRISEAVNDRERELKWCLGKVVLTLPHEAVVTPGMKERILACAD